MPRHSVADILASNAKWASDVESSHADFFTESAKGQAPAILWFGCADSRVPESVVCAQEPGQIFVHRNIANRFDGKDDSANAVLEYAVKHVKVDHVVVVGHTKCGGCIAAYGSPAPTGAGTSDALGNFLAPLIALRHSLPEGASVTDLVKANVKRGVEEIVASKTIKDVLANPDPSRPPVQVHGLMYHLETGKLEDLGMTVTVGK